MKVVSLLVAVVVLFDAAGVSGQMLDSDRVVGAGFEAPEVGDQFTTIMVLPTNPVTFNHIVKDSAGEYSIGPAVSLGASAVLVLGRSTYLGESTQLEPLILVGAGLDFGIREATDGEDLETGVHITGMVGFNRLAVLFGKDLLSDYSFVGVGLKVDLITLLRDDLYATLWSRPVD